MSKSSTRVIYPSLSKSYNLKAPVKQMYTYCQILHISWPMLKVIRFFQLWYNTVQPVPLNTFLLKAHDWPILLEIAICCFLSFFLLFFFFGYTLASNNIMSGFIFVTVQSVMSLPCWSSIGQELLSDLSIYIYIYILTALYVNGQSKMNDNVVRCWCITKDILLQKIQPTTNLN